MTIRIALSGALLALAFASALSLTTPTLTAETIYSLRIRATDLESGLPLSKVRVGLRDASGMTGTVVSVDGQDRSAVAAIEGNEGLNLGESSQVVVKIPKGTYEIEFARPQYKTRTFWVIVPSPANTAGNTELDFACGMEKETLTVSFQVLRTDNGRPVPNAWIRLSEAGSVDLPQSQRTNGNGIAIIGGVRPHDPKRPATYRLEVSARGYRDYAADDLASSRIGVAGAPRQLEIRLKPAEEPEQLPFNVKVVEAKKNEPIPNAAIIVRVKGEIDVPPVKYTDLRGLSPVFRIDAESPDRMATYQVEVSARRFTTRTVELPAEFQKKGGSRTFVVELEPFMDKRPAAMTPSERAAWGRVEDWVKSHPKTDIPQSPQTSVLRTTLYGMWIERKGTAENSAKYIAKVYMKHLGDAQEERAIPKRPNSIWDAPVSLGGIDGFYSSTKGYVIWRQGRFDVELRYDDLYLSKPSKEEIVKIAGEIAGVIGDPGK